MRRRPASAAHLLLLVVLGSPPVAAQSEPRILSLDLPGALVAGAPTRGETPSLWLLTREAGDDEPWVHRFDTGSSPRLALRAFAPPDEVRALAPADFDGDGRDDLVLLAPGSWSRVEPTAATLAPVPLHEGEARWVGNPGRGTFVAAGGGPPALARVGGLALLTLSDGEPSVVLQAELPIRASARPWGLRLESPTVRPVPGGGWVAWDEPRGPQIPTTWIPPSGSAVSLRLLLPEPERIESARPLRIDGSPYLFVATFVHVGPMANQRIRLFPLGRFDGPVRPVLAREMEVHIWHSFEASVADLDADGKEDLLLAVPEGMGGGDLRLLAFHRTTAGGFAASPAASKLGLGGAAWHFGDDLDGDGRPDLLLLSGTRLVLYPGPRPGAALPPTVGTDLSASFPAPAEAGVTEVSVQVGSEVAVESKDRPGPLRHEVLDVDGDGVAEVLLWRIKPGDTTRLVIVAFGPSGSG